MRMWIAFPTARVPWKILVGVAMLFLWPAALYGAPISIAKIQELNFGFCDATPSVTYTVLPAASPGASACQGAGAARFDITGDPNKKAKITIANTVTIINGTESMAVTITDSAGGQFICLGAGAVTLWVGGSVTIPAGGLTSNGLFTVSTTLALSYAGGTC